MRTVWQAVILFRILCLHTQSQPCSLVAAPLASSQFFAVSWHPQVADLQGLGLPLQALLQFESVLGQQCAESGHVAVTQPWCFPRLVSSSQPEGLCSKFILCQLWRTCWLFQLFFSFWGSLQKCKILLTSQLSREHGTGAHPNEVSVLFVSFQGAQKQGSPEPFLWRRSSCIHTNGMLSLDRTGEEAVRESKISEQSNWGVFYCFNRRFVL